MRRILDGIRPPSSLTPCLHTLEGAEAGLPLRNEGLIHATSAGAWPLRRGTRELAGHKRAHMLLSSLHNRALVCLLPVTLGRVPRHSRLPKARRPQRPLFLVQTLLITPQEANEVCKGPL